MSLLSILFGGKKTEEVFDPRPAVTSRMPARPYRVLRVDLPFYSDPECRAEVGGARLVILQCEDPAQKQRPIECVPTRKQYTQGQMVNWDINHKQLYEAAWYRDSETGVVDKAWTQAVEFIGQVVEIYD